jgi:uncharacterized integral membrane protein (TIGR00698 family)
MRLPDPRIFWSAHAPGIVTALLVAFAATFVSETYGGPQFLYALFFGISLNFLASDPKTRQGIQFTARTILRVGVALLGVQITLDRIATLGASSIALVMVAVVATLLAGVAFGRLLKRPLAEGIITGGAVAICGASAALAISASLPRSQHTAQFTLLTVVGVTALSTVAMVIYPTLIPLLRLDAAGAGVLLGGTIHDVAQVVGAGYMVSPAAAEHATFVKLLRVAMLVPIVFVLSLRFRPEQPATLGRRFPLPWFLVLFVVLAGANSAGGVPDQAREWLSSASRWCLVSAIAALGVMTSFRDLSALGWRPVALLIAETTFLAVFVTTGLLTLRS